MQVNKDTKIFGSFAKKAGNNGCNMFNPAFERLNINAIYRSFSVDNIEAAIISARILGFSGFAVTMPFKKEACKYVDILTEEVQNIGALNTVVNRQDKLVAYNTDFLAAQKMLRTYKHEYNDKMYILGNGGYSAAVQYAAKTLGLEYDIISRNDWGKITEIKDTIVYNCTPVENLEDIIDDSVTFIDCIVTTLLGYALSKIQAEEQFYLYTGQRTKL